MFCPSCGSSENESNQFCRTCGTDLRVVRTALEKPDNVTASAIVAREEIGRAIADKIREVETAHDLKKVAEDVLPQIEKFLESPEERRLRRFREGTIVSAVGLGIFVMFTVVSFWLGLAGVITAGSGFLVLCVGLGILVNGIKFTVPKKVLPESSAEATPSKPRISFLQNPTNELVLPETQEGFTSVTENTTRHLSEKQFVKRQ